MIKSLVAVYRTAICERCTDEHNRLFEGFNNYRQTTDITERSILLHFVLYTVYCTYKIAKDVFKIVLYVTTFYKQH